MNKNAILIVSFGTTNKETREKNIDKIENCIRENFKDFLCFHAYTSSFVRKKILQNEGIYINSPEEALDKIYADGFENIFVVTTHIMNATETKTLANTVENYRGKFKSIKLSDVLISTTNDIALLSEILIDEVEYLLNNETAVIFMGHGSKNGGNEIFFELQEIINQKSLNGIYIATVKDKPSIYDILEQLKKCNYKKLYLQPLMLVAGEHAINDMSGKNDYSWKNILTTKGYDVECIIKGLGEIEAIQKMYVKKAEKIIYEV